jgi:hypothetical protein
MQATADMGNGKQEEEIDVMILRSLTTSAMLSGGIGAEIRGDIAAHGHGSERCTDGTDWSERSRLGHECDEARRTEETLPLRETRKVLLAFLRARSTISRT